MSRVVHRRVKVAGVDTFVREAGPPDAPVLVLPQGYPCSSFAYRRDLPAVEIHLLDAGHWVLETQLEQCVSLLRPFLDRTLPTGSSSAVR